MDMQIFANSTIDFIIKNLNELDERGIVDILLLMDNGNSLFVWKCVTLIAAKRLGRLNEILDTTFFGTVSVNSVNWMNLYDYFKMATIVNT